MFKECITKGCIYSVFYIRISRRNKSHIHFPHMKDGLTCVTITFSTGYSISFLLKLLKGGYKKERVTFA